MSAAGMFALGLPLLALHLFSIALTKALQSYSRSLLELRCAARGRPERAVAIAHLDQRTERSAESLAVVAGLSLAALAGMGIKLTGPAESLKLVILLVLAIGLLGYVCSGVIGKVFAESIVDVTWPAFGVIRTIAWPLTFGLRQVERLVGWAAGRSESPQRPASVEVEFRSEEELSDDSEPELPDSARVLLKRAVELTRTEVSEIMTPRPLIVSLPATVSAGDAAATFRQSGLSRIPVYGANHDDIIGILYAKDLFPRMTEAKDGDSIVPRKLLRPAYFVPETKNAFELLEELRGQRRQIAMVLDEYGGVAGLVTLEDLLEELVGTIDDEHDIPTPADPIREVGESRYEVEATLPVDELNERLGLHLPTNGEYLTVGGLAFHTLGRVPEPGESFSANGVDITVVDIKDHRIRRLVVDLKGTEPATGTSPARLADSKIQNG
jgi:CBS domain containing-hemolysin-like protein